MTKLIEANTTIPTKKTQVFSTAADNQPAVDIVVLQGERPMSKDNKLIGTFVLDGIMPARRGVPQIEVTFDIDANGILSVSAKDLGTGKEQHITINDSNALSQEEIDKIKADAEAFKGEDEKKQKEINEINQAETFVYSTEQTMESLKDKITDDERAHLEDLVKAAEEKISTRNLDDIKSAKEELEKVWAPIAQKLYQSAQGANANTQGTPNASDIFGNGDGPFGGFDFNNQNK